MDNYSTSRKVAVFLADGCEEIEALTVVDLLTRSGIPRTMVSINPTREVTSSHGVTITADTTVDQLPFDEYDMLVLPGGIPGTPNLEACSPLCDALKRFAASGKQIAAICAAPSILAHLGLLKDVKATCNPSFEDDLEQHGARLTWQPVTVCRNFITSQAMGTAIPFGLAIVTHYLGDRTATELRDKIKYRQ